MAAALILPVGTTCFLGLGALEGRQGNSLRHSSEHRKKEKRENEGKEKERKIKNGRKKKREEK